MSGVFPDVVARKKITGNITVSGVDAGATVTRTITLNSNYLIIGMPKVTTPTADAVVKVVNGGDNEFTVEITNNAGAAQDVAVEYEVNVLVGV